MSTIQIVSSIGTLLAVLTGFAVYLLQRRAETHRESTDAVAVQTSIATSATELAQTLQREMHTLRSQISDLPQLRLDLASAQEQIRGLQNELSIRTTRIEELERQLLVKTHELESMHAQYHLLEQRFDRLAQENNNLYAEIGRLRTNMQSVAISSEHMAMPTVSTPGPSIVTITPTVARVPLAEAPVTQPLTPAATTAPAPAPPAPPDASPKAPRRTPRTAQKRSS